MKKYKGSFSMEASYILPIILACILVVIDLSVLLHEEVHVRVEMQMEKASVDMVKAMYRREYIKELLGEYYED